MKREILTILRRADAYVSGQQICVELGVSRTSVWKAVNALKAEGYEIEAVQNRGYRLTKVPDVLTEAEIGSRRTDPWRERPLVVCAETDSTNRQAEELAGAGNPEGTLVVADVQRNGRGRRGRAWEMPPGTGVALSLILRPDFAPQTAPALTLLAALAGRRAVRDLTGRVCAIKWPNDLVLGRKKFCGILTEMNLEEDQIRQIVLGIGINVNQASFPAELEDRATSLYLETGEKSSRAGLLCRLLAVFAPLYEEFCRSRSLAFVCDEYNDALICRGEEVRILTAGSEWRGTARGIDERGALLVEREDGHLGKVTAGEVSVRGLYHYT